MGFKALFGLTMVPAALLVSAIVACASKRIRDYYFVLLIFLSPLVERWDVNFFSRDWYRGTSRGCEVSVLDILAFGLLTSAVLAPRRGESRFFWPASLGLMLLFFSYVCFNVSMVEPKLFACFELFRLVRGFILVLGVAL